MEKKNISTFLLCLLLSLSAYTIFVEKEYYLNLLGEFTVTFVVRKLEETEDKTDKKN